MIHSLYGSEQCSLPRSVPGSRLPIFGVLDIDGSLLRQLYHFDELLDDRSVLEQIMAIFPPFTWVKKSGIIDKLDSFVAVTGRPPQIRGLTVRWFMEHFNVSPELIMVSYVNKQQYINDKQTEIRRVVKEWTNEHGKSRIVFVEDDIDIIRFIQKEFLSPNWSDTVVPIIVEVDGDGTPTDNVWSL